MNNIDEIKSRLDIVDIVSESVKLKRSGKNYTGFCPFHANTRTPAFVVFPESGTWRCLASATRAVISSARDEKRGLGVQGSAGKPGRTGRRQVGTINAAKSRSQRKRNAAAEAAGRSGGFLPLPAHPNPKPASRRAIIWSSAASSRRQPRSGAWVTHPKAGTPRSTIL